MGDSGPAIFIMFFVLLLLDMFLYGFGAAIVNLNEKEIERRAKEERDKKSEKLLKIIGSPDRYVNMVQLVATLINVIAGAVYLNLWRNLVQQMLLGEFGQFVASSGLRYELLQIVAVLLPALLLLYIFLTFGVLLPKRIARRIPEKWAYLCIGPVNCMIKLFAPFTGLVSVTVRGILYLFGVREYKDENDVTEEEIINMVQEGFEQGVIEDNEAEMISNIFAYGDKEARDIMTHRSNVVAIDGNMKLKDAIDFMLDGINSRYPVYEENLDHIIGVLHLKDALRYRRGADFADDSIKNLKGLLREPHFVPQTKNIDELFEEMQSDKQQMVIVVDEYGQMAGLVAMEDILEEIVGNILDEYDEDTKYIQERGKDQYVMDGKTPLEDLAESFHVNFDGEEFETLNGFMIARLDHIPEPGEEFEVNYQGYHFKILSVEHHMIRKVLVTKLPEEVQNTAEGPETEIEKPETDKTQSGEGK